MRDIITEHRLNIVLALILLGGPLIAHFADEPFLSRSPPAPRSWRWPVSASTSRWGLAVWSPSATRPSLVSAAMPWAFSPATTRPTNR
jgi:hypothetical protein